jgi:hypothetical protein
MITERYFQHLFSLLGHSIPNFGNELSCPSCFLRKKPYLVIEHNGITHILECDAFSSHPFGTPPSWEKSLLVSQAVADDLRISPSSSTALLKNFVLLCPNDADDLRHAIDQQNKADGQNKTSLPSIDMPEFKEKLRKELEDILGHSPDKN